MQFSLALVFLFLVGCQQAPTRIYRSTEGGDNRAATLNRPLEITAETQLVDARSRLQTGLAKVAGAIPVHWDDFTKRNKSSRGSLDTDIESVARRLAIKGIAKDRPVIVLGEGPLGNGEDGRLAWMFLYLGFKDVQTSTVAALPLRRSTGEEPPVKNEKPWEIELKMSLLAEAREVITNAVGKKPRALHLIDVRTPREYFARDKKTESYLDPDLRAINIEWKEFFTKDGRPNSAIRSQLEAIGINTSDRIVVISSEGVRSGAVTYALTMMGYTNAGNYAAGWKSLKP